MSKTTEQLKPVYAPIYAALYPALAKVFQKHGYALAIHGSMARDFDIIAVPWTDNISEPQKVVDEITDGFDIWSEKPIHKNYARLVYTVHIAHGECALDLSFFPYVKKNYKNIEANT